MLGNNKVPNILGNYKEKLACLKTNAYTSIPAGAAQLKKAQYN